MAKRQKKADEQIGNWLDTYADMVTLLLTFFVMLYASSSLDEQKWQYIYQAFQSHGKYLNEYVDSPEKNESVGDGVTDEDPTTNGGSGEMPQSWDRLYVYLSEYITENDLVEEISVEQGAAHVKLRFDDSVFFAPNSSELTERGREVLNGIAPALRAVEKSIMKVTVSGHTAAAISAVNDWSLSAGRAVSVVNYMEFRSVLPTSKFRVQGCGPTEPVADNNTEEGRSKNRRVEMLIIKNDLDLTNPEVLKDIMEHDYGIIANEHDPDAGPNNEGKLPDGSAESIIENIESMFPGTSTGGGVTGFDGPTIIEDFTEFLYSAGGESEAADDQSAAGESE